MNSDAKERKEKRKEGREGGREGKKTILLTHRSKKKSQENFKNIFN